jgi:exopolyphosphatase/guanosine-5'-triphosphate,3'-diphosphate pyrophosphatase
VPKRLSWRVESEEQTAVIDLGSNSFRLVVFTASANGWWKRTDEIYEPVRVGAGMGKTGELGAKPMARALRTIEAFVHFCRATGIEDGDITLAATSAIRDAKNREAFLAEAEKVAGHDIRVLSTEEEAFYGYLAGVNSTTLADGAVLDLGGGSLQLVEVRSRHEGERGSWPLGAVRMTERFLTDEKSTKKQLKALRAHVAKKLESDAAWLGGAGPRIVGIGGTLRNLAAAAQKRAELPSSGVQGFTLTRDALESLVAELADMAPEKRGAVPGIKPERGDVILAGAATIAAILETGGFDSIEVTEAGLREGIFFGSYLHGEPPLFEDVRRATIFNLARQYEADRAHVEHVARLALEMFDGLAAAGVHDGDPLERELLWSAAMLHDIGVAVDYDDHHKHSRYLVLNAGLPGFTPREVALVAQLTRYHRKGSPSLGELSPLTEKGDEGLLLRGSALLRLAEQLERARDQLVSEARVSAENGNVAIELVSDGDTSVARWAAERQHELFEEAFGRSLALR